MKHLVLIVACLLTATLCFSQEDSTIEALQKISLNYFSGIDKKVDKYSARITSATEKTLEKLCRWEKKIKSILERVSPATASQLFGAGQQTFETVLQKIREGKQVKDNYQSEYDGYRDRVTTDLNYLSSQKGQLNQKVLLPLSSAKAKMDSLNAKQDNAEALNQFIKERKEQLINRSIQHLGNSKYLNKINKEAWYYLEKMKNYKAMFNSPGKAEETVKTALLKIPFFQQFVRKNSQLASLFVQQGEEGSLASIAGLQTRVNLQSILQERFFSGNPNALQEIQQNIQEAKSQISQLKDKILAHAGGSNENVMPDFKPNMQKTKTLKERIEVCTSFQSAKSNGYLPVTSDLGLLVGYKINDKSVIGLGASYRMGWGQNFQHIKVTSEGLGLRSFINWKLKGSFYIAGGYEQNYNAGFKNIAQLRRMKAWQQSALIGLSKKIKLKGQLVKGTNIQLLYDLLYKEQALVKQPIIFRVGYTF